MSDLQKNRLKTTSRLMAHLCLAAIIVIPVGYLLAWFDRVDAHDIMSVHGSRDFIRSPDTSLGQRLGAFALSMVPQIALLYGLVHLRGMFLGLRHGPVFSAETAAAMKKFARALLVFAVLDFIMAAPLSAWVTFSNPPGERLIQLGLGEADLHTWFLIALFYAISHMVVEGIRLVRENEQFV